MHSMVILFSIFEPEEDDNDDVDDDDVCQSAQTSQRMTLTFMVCLLKTTISETGIVGFEKIELELVF